MWTNKDFLILFGAANDAADMNRDGVADDYSMNTYGLAKNCLTVGGSESIRPPEGPLGFPYGVHSGLKFAIDPIFSDLQSDNSNGMAAFSGRGPSLDGRYKPELVAPATNVMSVCRHYSSDSPDYRYDSGTSMATPLTAGAAALVREFFMKEKGMPSPSAALIKTALVHGAVDMSPGQYGVEATRDVQPAPDNSQGWGRLNLKGVLNSDPNRTVEFVDNEGIATGEKDTYSFTVADGAAPLRVALGWTDYPGSNVVAGGGLVNDLDLCVKNGASQIWYADNALDLSESHVVSHNQVSFGYDCLGNATFGMRMTAPEYPVRLEWIAVDVSSTGNEETPLTLVIYNWTEDGPGEEIYRKEYGYLPGKEVVLPVHMEVAQDVFVAFEISDVEYFGIWYEKREGERALIKSGNIWEKTDRIPMVSAMFRTRNESAGFDRVNNTLSLTIPNPTPGTYAIEVTGHDVPEGPQPYALIYSGLTTAISTSGDASVDKDPMQPDAPVFDVINTRRESKSRAEMEREYGVVLSDGYSELVMFNCTVGAGDQAKPLSMRYAVKDLPAGPAKSIKLKKLLGNGASLVFNYPEYVEYKDGNWWLTTAQGTYVAPSTIIDSSATYYVVSVVQDNGPYDLNPAILKIDDPQVLVTPDSSDGDGGCTTGQSQEWLLPMLLVAAMLVAIRRKIRVR